MGRNATLASLSGEAKIHNRENIPAIGIFLYFIEGTTPQNRTEFRTIQVSYSTVQEISSMRVERAVWQWIKRVAFPLHKVMASHLNKCRMTPDKWLPNCCPRRQPMWLIMVITALSLKPPIISTEKGTKRCLCMAQHRPSSSSPHPVEEHSHMSWLLHLWLAAALSKLLKHRG